MRAADEKLKINKLGPYAAGPSVAHDKLCLFLSSVSPMALSPSVQVIPKLDAVFRVPLFYAEFSPFGAHT